MEGTVQFPGNLRHPKGYISSININLIHYRNPWVSAWWSAAFPGFGHILLGRFIKGFILIIWEVYINYNSNLNIAIIYAFTGRFELSKTVLDKEWALLYISVFLFAIWDSYRATIDLNKISILADRENSYTLPAKMNSVEINIFDKRIPWVAAVWNALMPGVGSLYIGRLPTGFFFLIWWIAFNSLSHFIDAIYYTFIGDFIQSKAVTDPEWILFIPSVYGFAIHNVYVNTVEYNKLFDREQSKFLKENYQKPGFIMPV